jgi:cytochrome P450
MEHPSINASRGIGAASKKWPTIRIRLFLFAGHNSTASTICYCYHLLRKHPEALARIHAEHDKAFGTDLPTVATQILEEPQNINLLLYTNEVLKEAMRLFPAAAGIRGGLLGVELQCTNGVRLPTEYINILMLHITLQRDP